MPVLFLFGKPVKTSLWLIPSRPRCLLSDDINSGVSSCQRLMKNYWLIIKYAGIFRVSTFQFAVMLWLLADVQAGSHRDFKAGSESENAQNLLGHDDMRTTNRVCRQLLFAREAVTVQ